MDVDQVVAQFERSAAYAMLPGFGVGLRWTRPMLEMANDLLLQAHEIDEFDLMLFLKLLAETRFEEPAQAESLSAELRAFFIFAADDLHSPYALGCLRILSAEPRWIALALEREAKVRPVPVLSSAKIAQA